MKRNSLPQWGDLIFVPGWGHGRIRRVCHRQAKCLVSSVEETKRKAWMTYDVITHGDLIIDAPLAVVVGAESLTNWIQRVDIPRYSK